MTLIKAIFKVKVILLGTFTLSFSWADSHQRCKYNGFCHPNVIDFPRFISVSTEPWGICSVSSEIGLPTSAISQHRLLGGNAKGTFSKLQKYLLGGIAALPPPLLVEQILNQYIRIFTTARSLSINPKILAISHSFIQKPNKEHQKQHIQRDRWSLLFSYTALWPFWYKMYAPNCSEQGKWNGGLAFSSREKSSVGPAALYVCIHWSHCAVSIHWSHSTVSMWLSHGAVFIWWFQGMGRKREGKGRKELQGYLHKDVCCWCVPFC